MQIGTLARRTGTTPHAIRFYERRGLLPLPEREENGYRDYSEAAATRCRQSFAALWPRNGPSCAVA